VWAAPGPGLEQGCSRPPAVPRPPQPTTNQSPGTGQQPAAPSLEAVTTDRLGNKIYTSYLIKDFIDKSLSQSAVGQEGGHPGTAGLGPQQHQDPLPVRPSREPSRRPSPLSGKAAVVSGTLWGLRGRGGRGGHRSRQHITNW